MKKKTGKDKEALALRRRAEERLSEKEALAGPHPGNEDTLKLVHELSVHQIELEMQNEELMKARSELELNLEKYSDLYHYAPVGYFTLAEDGMILEINFTGANLLGKERSFLINRKFCMFLSEESKKTFWEFLKKVFVSSIKETSEVVFFDKHGKPKYLHIEGINVNYGENIDRRCLMIAQDITERKHLEEELSMHREGLEDLVRQRTAELEDRNKKLAEEVSGRKMAEEEKRTAESQLAQTQRIEALDRFAGGIAHDLNNILYPIIINIEELLDGEPRGSVRHEILDQTLKAAHRQKDLVKKILSFSRRSEIIHRPIQIKPLIEETLKFLKSSLPSTISIEQNISVKADVIMGDPVQIEQVIMNLCQNAVDAYESQKGTIEIGLTNTYMDSASAHHGMQAGEYLKLTVKDNGQGMKLEVMSRIFEPFFTSKAVGKGTGMGLSVVHGIVKSHGGSIAVESGEGKGSLFTVYLPFSLAECQSQTSPDDRASHVQGKERVLLVDDEDIILSSLQRALNLSGYQVTALKNGLEAFRLFDEKPDEFDLVITDLTMPGMTGLELAGKLKEKRSDIPIILCTGYNDVISQQEAKSLGIKELLLKPASSRDVKEVIRRALEE